VGARFSWTLLFAVACSDKTVEVGGRVPTSSVGNKTPDAGTGGAGQLEGSGGSANGGSGGVGEAEGSAGGSAEVTDAGPRIGPATGLATTHKLDLLLLVDNSSSMKDKQDVLSATIPKLVQGLVASGSGITDIHVGVVTSSLGDHGAGGTCPDPTSSALAQEENDDHAHLIGTRPRGLSLNLPNGFVSWTSSQPTTTLATSVSAMVAAADQQGCGFESTLEAAYRFLADPAPPLSIDLLPCAGSPGQQCAQRTGLDSELMTERAAFLRPDSAVALIVLSDENDCSVKEDGQSYLIASRTFTPPNGSTPCATNPNDPCCYNCQIGPAAGTTCPAASADPNCQSSATKADNGHNFNLRCFDEIQRFGKDFLYPVERYQNAFRLPTLCTSKDSLDPNGTCADADGDGKPDLHANPLFARTGATPEARGASLVFMLGIVGVPWQDIAAMTDAGGKPLPTGTLRYQSSAELVNNDVWSTIYGNPKPGGAAPPVLPTDPLMLESTSPRSGSGPAGLLVGPTNAPRFGTAGANAANGHEWNNVAQGDLEYACIFQLAQPRDDSMASGTDCYQSDPNDFNPLCQAPDGTYGTTQYFAKGYPGLRELGVLQGLGSNGIVSSICARNTTDDTAPDYGYSAAGNALLEALAPVAK